MKCTRVCEGMFASGDYLGGFVSVVVACKHLFTTHLKPNLLTIKTAL